MAEVRRLRETRSPFGSGSPLRYRGHMGDESNTPKVIALGLVVAALVVVARWWLLLASGVDAPLTPWLLVQSFPDRMIEALILGVLAVAVSDRVDHKMALGFNAFVLSWALIGIPLPNVGDLWGAGVAIGWLIAGFVQVAGRWGDALWRLPVIWVGAGVVALSLPGAMYVSAGDAGWRVEHPVQTFPAGEKHTELSFTSEHTGLLHATGAVVADVNGGAVRLPAEVSVGDEVRLQGAGFESVVITEDLWVEPQLATSQDPSYLLVLLVDAGKERVNSSTSPVLGSLVRTGVEVPRAMSPSSASQANVASIFAGEPLRPPHPEPGTTSADTFAAEGYTTAFFGTPGLSRATRAFGGFDTAAEHRDPDVVAELAAYWLQGVAGARFFLTVAIPMDAPTDKDLEGAHRDPGLRAADRAVASVLAHVERLELAGRTRVCVVGTGPLEVPLHFAGPGFGAGHGMKAPIDTSVILRAMRQGQVEGNVAHLLTEDAAGVRAGDWILIATEDEDALYHLTADPECKTNLSLERPSKVEELRKLLRK